MPKKNLLISAALTAFVLVIATGIASAYKRVNATLDNVNAASAAGVQPVVNSVVQAVPVTVTHQEAALVAANFLGQTDLYSVENVLWEGVDAYQVVFSSGDTVYVSMTGEILGTEAPQPVVIVQEANASNGSISSSTNARSSNSTASYNDDDDHGGSYEGDHDDDHDDGHEDEHDDD